MSRRVLRLCLWKDLERVRVRDQITKNFFFTPSRSAFLGGGSELSDQKQAEAAGAAATCSEQAALPPRNAIESQRETNADTSDLLSPKTLFPDDSNYTKTLIPDDSNYSPLFSSVQLPEEQFLTQIVSCSLKLPPAVALQIARSMKDTVAQNIAASDNFRAQFVAARGPQQFEVSALAGSAVGHALALAERAVQVKAARAAEEEEEKFHAMVVAAQGRRQLC